MHDALTTEAWRYVAALRREADNPDPLETGPDAFILEPLNAALRRAVADLLEYHVTVSGGFDGVGDVMALVRKVAPAMPSIGAPACSTCKVYAMV